jgi:hypothetical protein
MCRHWLAVGTGCPTMDDSFASQQSGCQSLLTKALPSLNQSITFDRHQQYEQPWRRVSCHGPGLARCLGVRRLARCLGLGAAVDFLTGACAALCVCVCATISFLPLRTCLLPSFPTHVALHYLLALAFRGSPGRLYAIPHTLSRTLCDLAARVRAGRAPGKPELPTSVASYATQTS